MHHRTASYFESRMPSKISKLLQAESDVFIDTVMIRINAQGKPEKV